MSNQQLEYRLKARNIQPTAMRLLVLQVLQQQNEVISLADLEESLSRSDRTTLYRTLKTFQEHGLVHQVYDDSGNARYALCSDDCSCSYPDDIHVHFLCTACDRRYYMEWLTIPDKLLPENCRTDSASFVISGAFSSCTQTMS